MAWVQFKMSETPAYVMSTNMVCLRNEFHFWYVHGITNTSGLLQS